LHVWGVFFPGIFDDEGGKFIMNGVNRNDDVTMETFTLNYAHLPAWKGK